MCVHISVHSLEDGPSNYCDSKFCIALLILSQDIEAFLIISLFIDVSFRAKYQYFATYFIVEFMCFENFKLTFNPVQFVLLDNIFI